VVALIDSKVLTNLLIPLSHPQTLNLRFSLALSLSSGGVHFSVCFLNILNNIDQRGKEDNYELLCI
jgi:hypothetical protein